ncbi:LEAF RUST 10 DISEASE-RESISTANCE LOCUS RECEPTOR-LIKE PROTEIN KINASE-like 2.1 isoform X3 [Lotus japonicus]|uniref:LEAF RUST 10 DISEASE-RESISTANCE LOCUS RECEPTOR-LIKE PROTEIN KINASE-like 2.1 isoform X3 n=1 Tax=Lotus japonicus TaxID=34305 RepID=UPI002584CC65|nr:LEAF RUST 10 DISEASE-RESISTANCE LOCUS RECEPTOR-LIKE PROTEIN KINASE-like 2.1 isoform X3 [Lotus japonicus]
MTIFSTPQHMALPLLPLPFSFIYTLFYLSLLFYPTYAASDAELYTACAPFSCGNFSNISYPFWSSNQPSSCGNPNFKLDCKQGNATIEIKSQKFPVLNISQNSLTLKIATLDSLGLNGACPKHYANVSLGLALFSYTSNDDDFILLYDCRPPSYSYSPISTASISFTCGTDSDPHQGYFMSSKNVVNFDGLGCKNKITVPASKDAFQNSFSNGMTVESVLAQGFEVGWSGVDGDKCDGCTKSGGRCGYNTSLNALMCLCPKEQSNGGVCSIAPALSPLPEPRLRQTPLQALSPHSEPDQSNYHKSATTAGLSICFTIFYFICKSSSWHGKFCLKSKSNLDIEAFLKNQGALTTERYKFSYVKKITDSFKVKLGQGGFGAVYKGKLPTGSLVAVKILNSSKGNGQDFVNEVASISRTSHVNIVNLLGFCLEGQKKALIYEFMPNGSLDKFIYQKGPENIASLSWQNLYQIAIGIARGLEYLHKGCNTRILHFDIKPHNILLDENFCPKISDFGLAKLCPRKESIISMSDARGTMGYVAPELWNRHFGGVSHKADVYSYGMMLLEMVGGRKNINAEASHTSEIYFPHWVYNRLELGSDLGLNGVMAQEDNEIAGKMTLVGLWCIQTIPNDRPAMSKVIDMLERNIDSLEIPPKPILSSPTRSMPKSSTISCEFP